ncbi:uncharacterized protein LOC135462616 [Liolophura sinensis]|uniref:uncharacterized protein LOC135462616 n=1 Tax=Liolophura sinensis TaxID=3198878 RepID=UPI003159781B
MGCSGSVPAESGRDLHAPRHGDQVTEQAEREREDRYSDVGLQNRNNSGLEGREVKGDPKQQSSCASGNSTDHVTPVQQNAPISIEEKQTASVKIKGCINTDQNSTGIPREVTASVGSEADSTPTIQADDKTRTGESLKENFHTTVISDPTIISNKEIKRGETVPVVEDRDQTMCNTGINGLNLCVKPESFIASVKDTVRSLTLPRALPYTVDIYRLMKTLTNLQVLDVSNNQLGPQPFRLLMLAVATNTSLISLKAANNGADTDSAACVGKLVASNSSLLYLDVSGNHLGKDYLSRCLSSAVKVNSTLETLRLEGTGGTDLTDLLEGLTHNSTLTHLDISNNHISDRVSVGTALKKCLQKSDCVLQSINLRNCNLSAEGLEKLREGLNANTSLVELVVSGNEFQALENLARFLLTCCSHTGLQQLMCENSKISEHTLTAAWPPVMVCSNLGLMNLCNSGVTTELLMKLETVLKGRLLCLEDINLGDNPALSPQCVSNILAMTTGDSGQSSLTRLTFGLNNVEELPDILTKSCLPFLNYLNLRKAKISAAGVSKLQSLITPKEKPMKTLVLDGLKLAGTEALKGLLGKPSECSLDALSLSGCLLNDADLSPLISGLGTGLSLHMLKLSANRITDRGVSDLVSALLGNKHHPLAVLDLSNNQVGPEGTLSLCGLFSTKSHRSCLHSLNLSHNNIDKAGLACLVSHVGSQIKTLYVNNQSVSLEEDEISEVLTHLGKKLGYSIQADDSGKLIEKSGANINTDGIFVNLSGLGGHFGEVGRLLDCVSIVTDYRAKQVPFLSLQHICQIAAVLRNSGTQTVVLSSEEWNIITGCKKDREIPSWLQVDECRKRAVYLTNLPGTTTTRRLEGLFESEADCEIDEICLLKDPVSSKMNGLAWSLMSDIDSVQRLMEYFHRGEAQVFGQPFLISPLLVSVDDVASTEVEQQVRPRCLASLSSSLPSWSVWMMLPAQKSSSKSDSGVWPVFPRVFPPGHCECCDQHGGGAACQTQVFGQSFLVSSLLVIVDVVTSTEMEQHVRQDRERRTKERKSDDVSHRNLIRQSAEESWKRHAYRLAHPAYADGRVW